MSLAIAKKLAEAAGLPVRESRRKLSELEEMERWFQASARPLLDQFMLTNDEARAIDEEREKAYTERRSKVFRERMEGKHYNRSFGRSIRHFCGIKLPVWRFDANEPGFYQWKEGKKVHQSWMGSRQMSLKSPKQIGGYLAQRYPGYDITILPQGYMNSTQFVAKEIMDSIVVPLYNVILTKRLPGWYLTAERMLLQGRLLDRCAAKELWDKYEAAEITQQEYAERISTLCRQAEKFDEPPTGWVEIDEKGEIREMEYDDTRDAVEIEETLGMMYNRGRHDDGALISPSICIKPTLHQWEEDSSEFEDLDDSLQVHLMLGLQTEQIENASEIATDTNEFLRLAHGTPKNTTKGNSDEIAGW